MIESISFTNFKALRDTTLPLGRFTLLVGPNGSGKSTALQALGKQRDLMSTLGSFRSVSVDMENPPSPTIQVRIQWATPSYSHLLINWSIRSLTQFIWRNDRSNFLPVNEQQLFETELGRIRIYSFDPNNLHGAVQLTPNMEMQSDGTGLAGVLDRLRDQAPERFETLNQEITRILPEFDRILFYTPLSGQRTFLLRTSQGHHKIPAANLSHGTLLLIALLTLAYLPEPPPLIGIEEPDRGIHPRLLREVQDAFYRLCYPENFGEAREPIQIVATTHSPYFLDLFRDHPEEIVIAQKIGLDASFERLTDRSDIHEILAEAPLGEVWYSGVLGGIPTTP